METYVTLGTGLGSRESGQAGMKALENAGCKLKVMYMLMGQYDFLLIFEAPDAATAAVGVYAARMANDSQKMQTQTLRAFDEAEATRFADLALKMNSSR